MLFERGYNVDFTKPSNNPIGKDQRHKITNDNNHIIQITDENNNPVVFYTLNGQTGSSTRCYVHVVPKYVPPVPPTPTLKRGIKLEDFMID